MSTHAASETDISLSTEPRHVPFSSSDRSERRGVTPAAGDEADQNLWQLIRSELQGVYRSLFVSLDGNTQLNEGFSSSRADLSSWTKRRVGSVLRHSSPGLTAPSSLSPISWKSLCVSAGQSFVVDEAVCCSRVCCCNTHWVLYYEAHTAVHAYCLLHHTDVFLQMSYMHSLRSQTFILVSRRYIILYYLSDRDDGHRFIQTSSDLSSTASACL